MTEGRVAEVTWQLARYAAVLARSLDATTRTNDRTIYRDHLAAAARWLGMLHDGATRAMLRDALAAEQRRFGWEHLSGESGEAATQAFERLVAFVDQVSRPAEADGPPGDGPGKSVCFGSRNSDFIAIEIEISSPATDWLYCQVSLSAGGFTARYPAHFELDDFARFHHELVNLHETLRGDAVLVTAEGQLELRLHGDGLGHVRITGRAQDDGFDNILQFGLGLDQSQLTEPIAQMTRVVREHSGHGRADDDGG